MSDGIINEWLDKQGDTKEACDVARLAVGWLMEDEPPASPDDDLVECEDCHELVDPADCFVVREADTGAASFYCYRHHPDYDL